MFLRCRFDFSIETERPDRCVEVIERIEEMFGVGFPALV